jgi:hypothetical protein
MLDTLRPDERSAMPTAIAENRAEEMLKAISLCAI